MTRNRVLIICLTALSLLAWGCSSSGGGSGSRGTGSSQSSSGGFNDQMGGGGSVSGDERGDQVSGLQTVYFDYDRAVVRGDQKSALEASASAIAGGSWGMVVVEGHCDERGSEEYNLALGERRATSVKRYLTDLGVPKASLDTVSFGESKAAVQGHDESAWRWNRRAEFRAVQ